MASKTFTPGTTIDSAWLNDVNTVTYKRAINYINVKEFGAVGDFDPSTGLGTDDRTAIQAAFDYAITFTGGCTVVFPPGRYYGGSAVGTYIGSTQITLGTTSASSAKNIVIEGYGAELYQGAAGRFIGLFGADRVIVKGLKIFGYTGGTLGATRQNDAIFTINYYSKNVTIENCYLTNTLGDCIYAGGSLVSGGEIGYETRNLIIRNNIIKERYGNGVDSSGGGTKSRLAIALIDVVGGEIHDNIIYGGIDIEPNLNNQHAIDVSVYDNTFKSGHVTAQAVIGTSYWYDEPINLSGGSVIAQEVSIQGVPASPIISGCSVSNNKFEYGFIRDYNIYIFDKVDGNFFQAGQIIVGSTSGANNTTYRNYINNETFAPLSGEISFIRLDGRVSFCSFINNRASGVTYCIDDNGASTGDNGRNIFVGNIQDSGTDVLGFTTLSTSIVLNNWVNKNTAFEYATSKNVKIDALLPTMQSVVDTGTGITVNWNTYPSNSWYYNTGASVTTIATISNAPIDGFELTIQAGASGGGSITLIHSASIVLKGAVNAVLNTNTQNITLISRGGVWYEKARNF